MAWREEHRLASFRTLAGANLWNGLPALSNDVSPVGSGARSRSLGAILWLQCGVRLGYWGREQAQGVVEELSPAYQNIYAWLKVHGHALPANLVDELLRIKDEGLSNERLSRNPPSEVVALHFRHALVVIGGYLPLRQGLWSRLVDTIMYGSDADWQSASISLGDAVPDAPEVVMQFIDDIPGLLRSMDAMLTVANAAARDDRLQTLQQEELSAELLVRLAWPLNLGSEIPRRRFRQFLSVMVARIGHDLEVPSVEYFLQKDIRRLGDAWERIEQGTSKLAVEF